LRIFPAYSNHFQGLIALFDQLLTQLDSKKAFIIPKMDIYVIWVIFFDFLSMMLKALILWVL